ncbi:MAG TPA: hypothetical protein VGB92_10680 [Longimicrobium sp.]|jgi:hypothetical protein
MQELDATRTISLEDDVFLVRFKYDPSIVPRIKAVPGSSFIAARKLWLVPPWPESAACLYNFGVKECFHALDSEWDEIQRLAALVPSAGPVVPEGIIRHAFRAPSTGGTLLHTEYNRALQEVVKELTGAYWDGRVKCLRVPASAELARALLYCVQEYDFLVEPDEYERLLLSAERTFEDDEESLGHLKVSEIVALRLMLEIPKYRRDMVLQTLQHITFQRGC